MSLPHAGTRRLPRRFVQHVVNGNGCASDRAERKADDERAEARAVMETLWQDARYAFRTIRRNPGFAAVAVLSLALGVGANTTIFTLLNAAFLAPLPLAQIHERQGDRGKAIEYYRRFLQYWGDEEIDRDRVADARRKLSMS